MEGRRRVTLYDQMSASLAGLTLDDILANQKRTAATAPSQPLVRSRTLLDIIKEDESNKKDRRSWKAFKDKLRLKRAGSAWTSSIHIPASDIPILIQHNRNLIQHPRRPQIQSNSDVSTQYMAHQPDDHDPTAASDAPAPANRVSQFSRWSSTRYGAPADGDSSETARPQLSRRNSTMVPSVDEPFRRGRVVTFWDCFDDDEPDDDKNQEVGRGLSARQAVAAQEASEAAAAAEAEAAAAGAAAAEEEENEPVKMSLMDLLEESDRQMGLEGGRYIMSDDEDFEEDEEEGGEEDEDGEGSVEYNCCICMVRHKGAAFIPCGHTFCRLCSRELMVTRGNCPLCNNFILEILDIF